MKRGRFSEEQIISVLKEAEAGAISVRGGRLGASLPRCRDLTQDARERGVRAAGGAVIGPKAGMSWLDGNHGELSQGIPECPLSLS